MSSIKHHLKILPEFYDKVRCGLKTGELRMDDRPYRRGDTIVLHEFCDGKYTGHKLEIVITDVYRGQYCKQGYCFISFLPVVDVGEPTVPLSVFREMFYKFCDVSRELEAMKENV